MHDYFNPQNKSIEQLRKEEPGRIRREKWREFWTFERKILIGIPVVALLIWAMIWIWQRAVAMSY